MFIPSPGPIACLLTAAHLRVCMLSSLIARFPPDLYKVYLSRMPKVFRPFYDYFLSVVVFTIFSSVPKLFTSGFSGWVYVSSTGRQGAFRDRISGEGN